MFEGSEKKIEVIFSSKSSSLLEKPVSFWEKIVRLSGARIISHSQFPKMHSFILSESSLFVSQNRLVLITCGQSALFKSLIKILKSFPEDSIEVCFFQRKNEFFPKIQKSCFYKDLKKIQKQIDGQAYRFGALHDHHFFLFHSGASFTPHKQDQTLETLIYDSEIFKEDPLKAIQHLKQELAQAFLGFEVQEQFFSPWGYSLNAVRGENYYTTHITPEKPFFYISFETNIREKSVQALTDKVLNIFKPLHFDFILFEPQSRPQETFESSDYFSSSSFYKVLSCGYNVTYQNFHKIKPARKAPVGIKKDETAKKFKWPLVKPAQSL